MNFNEYISEIWYKEHPLAKAFAESEDSDEVNSSDNSTEILQKLDWFKYCQNHSIDIEESFLDELFESIVSRFIIQASENETITYGDIADCIDYAPLHKKHKYDERLMETVENILTHNYEFDTTFNLFLSWTSNRFSLLTDVKLGFPIQEIYIMMSFYRNNRNYFIMKRDSDFPAMKVIANYFLRCYESCKTIDSPMISEDLIKIRYFLLYFMRDVLSSSIINGYYEHEERIKQIIEDLKLERADKPTVFISYTWSDDSGKIADRLQAELDEIATIRRDTTNLVTGDSLSEFMKTIRSQDFAILIVSDQYLRKRNCMYEMAQLLRDYESHEEDFWDKVLLFVTAKLYSEKEKAEIIGYWKQKIDENDAQIKAANSESTEVLVKEQKEFRYINMEIGKLLEYATDTLCEKDIDKFIEKAKERIAKSKV